MDKFDKAILAALQQQDRMSNQKELADAMGLSPHLACAACARWRRRVLSTATARA